jgi:hypothetical protein
VDTADTHNARNNLMIFLPSLWFWEPTWQEHLVRLDKKIELPWWISSVREKVLLHGCETWVPYRGADAIKDQ